jgi:hypothetical protein
MISFTFIAFHFFHCFPLVLELFGNFNFRKVENLFLNKLIKVLERFREPFLTQNHSGILAYVDFDFNGLFRLAITESNI